MKKNRAQVAKAGTPRLPLMVWLAYLLVCTLLLTGVSFSRYSVTNSGDDTARGAAGLLTVGYDNSKTNLEMERGTEDELKSVDFSFTVSNNNSEVAIRYDLVITLDAALPEGVTMELYKGEDSTPLADFSPASGTTCVVPDAGTFAAGGQPVDSYKLVVTGNYGIISSEYESNISISVQAEQID